MSNRTWTKREERHEIPRLSQRNGVYTVAWNEPAAAGRPARSRRFGLRTRDPVEAQARYAAFLTQGTEVFSGRSGAAGVAVAGALDDYYREHARTHTADPLRQENAITHLKTFFGDLPLREVDIPKCRAYATARRTGVLGRIGAELTIRRELVVLRAAANHAARWKRITSADMPTFEMPVEPRNGQEASWIDKEGIEVLLCASSGPLRDFIKLAYVWGARRGWVERLHVDQISLPTSRVNPYRSDERVTTKRRMILPIFPEIREDVERLSRAAVTFGGYLFGGPRVDFYRPFKQLCELMGYEDRSNPHVLRHSRATHMLMAGESIYKVARLLGDSVQTVERVYGHHSVEFLMEEQR